MDAFPLMKAQATGAVPLPVAAAPDLEGLEVRVPALEDLTEDDLSERFHELLREHATVRERPVGEPVQAGDDVQVDVMGYALGKLIPFSMRTDVWMELGPIPALPGFAEALVGTPVGEAREVRITLPADYPVESLRGVPATFLVSVSAGHQVTMPDPEAPETLALLGRGDSLEDVMGSLVEELEEEQADELWVIAQDMVLEEVARRSGVKVPAELVDEEIRRRWGQSEGRTLAELDFTPDEQQESLDGWLKDPATRAEAEQRLAIALALKAVAEKEKLVLTSEKMKELIEEAGEAFGLPPEEMRQALATDSGAASQVKNVAWHLLSVGYVMDRAKIHFEGAPDEA